MARGHVSEQLGQKEDALADYTLAIESHAFDDADQARALFDRGLLLNGMGRLNEALDDYGAALSLSPKFIAALNNRAGVYRRLGRFAEAQSDETAAREFYGPALAEDPHHSPASDQLAALPGNAVEPVPPGFASPSRQAAQDRFAGLEMTPAALAEGGVARQAKLAPAGRGHGALVQLGAWRSEEEAANGWDRARERAGAALEGLSPRIVAVDLPGVGRFYRLRVASDQTGSRALCTALAAKGQDCIPAHE